ncbi:hypothetical protein CsSME_00035941 [Camellia sinensis var. sinensis]
MCTFRDEISRSLCLTDCPPSSNNKKTLTRKFFIDKRVYDLVGLTELYYASNHGMDIMCPVKDSVSANTSNCIKFSDQQCCDSAHQWAAVAH